ncbi:FimV/HubP family polar landmark protein, partial [Vibrio sp. H11]|uniref:FimV/HubP family polar landmark protein n=1 Tax=Vibrio sp. H11 TaxID=2565928 RepID=UPI0023EF4E34
MTQTSIVYAEGIRLIGPGGEVQSEPQFSEQVVPARTSEAATPSVRSQQTAPVSARAANIMPSNEPSTFFGPTSEQDTLWSIASRLRPSPSVSVQQTLLAIYRLNPQAFENQNIHSLMPGSTLRVPSLAQVRSATTQEAVNVMNAHQARLNQTTARPVAPVQIAAPQPQPTPAAQPATPATTATPAAPDATPAPVTRSDVDKVEQQIASSDSEMLALEEKNHRLRLMLAEMQSEVDTLKNELGDENRIRSEVEKLLDEQRSKQQAEQKLAPSTWDQILSNGWLVGLMALIPGLAIAFLVLMLLNRRFQIDNQEQKPAEQTPPSQAETAAVVAGDETLQSLEDDLLLDDDLFGEADDSELTFSDETAEADDTQEDIFADLDENDLDFNLEDEDGEDPFAGIDDDGDLDTDFGGNSGISVNGDEKALGLEEMERTLDQAVQEPQDDDEAVFDLSDDDSAVQDDLDTLLGENDTGEELESGMLEQSMLDDLFNSSTDEDDDLAALDFDSLLDEDSLDDAKVTSDEELENQFSNIEAQADLDQLEAQSDEAALLDEMLDEDLELDIDSNSTELLDELLAESDEISAQNESDQMLDELLEQSASETADDAFDIDSDSLLDEWLEKEQESSETSEDEPEALAELDDGTEFFDELLEIEQQAQQPESEYNSTHFKNDLLDAVPDNDPLLEEFDFGDESEFSLDSDSDDAFEFSSQIEGSESEAKPAAPADEPVAPQSVSNQPEPVANEFGIPQDDDWLLDDPLGADSSGVEEIEPLSSADFMAGLEQQQQPEPEAAAEAEATPQEPELTAEASAESDPQTQEPDSQTQELDPQSEEPEPQAEDLAAQFTDTQAESEEEGFAFDDLDLPEYSEADALADSVAEPEAEAQPESSAQAEQPES